MDEHEWAGRDLPTSFGPYRYDVDVCPGWLQLQSSVLDGARAFAARRDGVLAEYFPNLEATILEAAEVAMQAFNLYEQERLRELKRKA